MTDDTQPAAAKGKHEFRPHPINRFWCMDCGFPYDEYNLHPRPEPPAAAMQASELHPTWSMRHRGEDLPSLDYRAGWEAGWDEAKGQRLTDMQVSGIVHDDSGMVALCLRCGFVTWHEKDAEVQHEKDCPMLVKKPEWHTHTRFFMRYSDDR